MNTKSKQYVINICMTAMFMALNVVFSSFSIPVPGGHLYLCDVIICTAAIILGPGYAFCVGGLGSFLGDMLFYPAPMFVSLASHGLQAVIISLFAHYVLKKKPVLSSIIGVTIGAIVMVIGYTLGRAYVYSTPEYAIIKLPFEFLQAGVGAVAGVFLTKFAGIEKAYKKIMVKMR